MSIIFNSLKILSIVSLLIGVLHIHEHEFHGHFEADEYEEPEDPVDDMNAFKEKEEPG